MSDDLIQRLVALERAVERLQTRETPLTNIGARLTTTGAISVPATTVTMVTWNAARDASAGMWSATTNPERLIAPVAGAYLITAHIAFDAAPANGWRHVFVQVTSGLIILEEVRGVIASGVRDSFALATRVRLSAGEYIRLFVNCSQATTIGKTDAYTPELTMHLLC